MKQTETKRLKKLQKLLEILCNVAIIKILSFKDRNKLIKIPYRYLPVKEIDYVLETYYYDWDKVKYFTYYEWRSINFIKFIYEELVNLSEYENVCNEMAKIYQIDADVVKKIGLFRFMSRLMKDVPNDKISKDNIKDFINLFINDYESHKNQIKTKWNISIWIKNIFMEMDEIELIKGVYLKRPTKDQLADISVKSYHTSEFERISGRGLPFGAILSFSIPAKSSSIYDSFPDEINAEIENWLNVLRLFKPCSAVSVFQSAEPVSIVENEISRGMTQQAGEHSTQKSSNQTINDLKLFLYSIDIKPLQSFISNIKPLLKGISHSTYLSGSSYDLAIHRYNDALINSEINVYRILSSITSLEALLSDSATEITFKIGLRVAKLSSYVGLNSSDVLEKMKIAYTIRNRLVHGSKVQSEKKGRKNPDLVQWAKENILEILTFNRLCLLIAIQLKNYMSKTELINLIDKSMIDPKVDQSLKDSIIKTYVPTINF